MRAISNSESIGKAASELRRVRDLPGAMMRYGPRVVSVDLILTGACELCCSYCFERDSTQSTHMHVDTANRAIRFLVSMSRDSDWFRVSFVGGEPMLRFGLIQEIVKRAKHEAAVAHKRVGFAMTTNGMSLDERQARFLSDAGIAYCLSLDGTAEDNDRHRRVRDGRSQYYTIAAKMRMLKRYQHWQGARVTVMPDTAGRLARNIAHLHHELAVNQFIIDCATSVPWSEEEVAEYGRGLMETFEFYLNERVHNRSQRLRIGLLDVAPIKQPPLERGDCGWGCGAGSGRLAVTPDGTLHGCAKLAFAANSARELLPLGTIETGLNRPENRRKLLDRSIEVRSKCHACLMAPRCCGGCYAANLTDTGNIYTPEDYYCKLLFAQVHATDYARHRLKELGLDNV
jgi:uncharacterized protein